MTKKKYFLKKVSTCLREERRVVVDVLEVDLDVSVADEAVAAVVLREHGEPPLRPAAGLIAVQRLRNNFLSVQKSEKRLKEDVNTYFKPSTLSKSALRILMRRKGQLTVHIDISF
jgi:hypothetical protein